MALSSDPLDILIQHNTWATRTLLELCRPLPTEQFHQDLGIGPGSLHDNLTHCIDVVIRWGNTLAGRRVLDPIDPRAGDDESLPRRGIDELLALLDAAARQWDRLLPPLRPRLGDVIERTFGDSPVLYRFTVAAAIIHVTNHGMHHRAQCLHMLKHLGVRVPDLEEIQWQHLGEP